MSNYPCAIQKTTEAVGLNKPLKVILQATPLKKAKDKLRKLTSRSQGRKLDTVLNNIKVFMRDTTITKERLARRG